MKFLVTGGAGFVGSHLVEQLVHDPAAEVKIYDSYPHQRYFDFHLQDYEVVSGDILDSELVNQACHGIDVVFHLAGAVGTDYLIKDPQRAVETNIIGTLNILEAARANSAKVVYLSLLPDWLNPYMITKNTATQFCQMYRNEFGLPIIVFRASHIYGKRQKWHPVKKAVPNFIRSALADSDISIFGTGEQLMDLIYVNDAASAMINCLKMPDAWGKVIELGSGIGITVRELALKIIDLSSSKSQLEYIGARPGEPVSKDAFVPADIHQLSNLIGNYLDTSLEYGLQQTIQWYMNNWSEIEPTAFNGSVGITQ
ncbi:MAG: NAD-dependent epimerase/dehydratase family protein [Caldilineaceae bacterium]|nr:NAD-dependent epimerase/dehydratase family protein [Caldilineaceae bacterium]MBP8109527.1 NAD-dependent epimerase/dehydratase family protein [Caldilineaceae bacterium]MBP8124753.1 NAD-dependent epimerase/dehydratase family protein [Caldilineaceae bacterium]MBP9074538.1 NAD-dependent epimerase/dehydratase family protein [Caldilineaceae bacterium]